MMRRQSPNPSTLSMALCMADAASESKWGYNQRNGSTVSVAAEAKVVNQLFDLNLEHGYRHRDPVYHQRTDRTRHHYHGARRRGLSAALVRHQSGHPPKFFDGNPQAFTGLRFHLVTETFAFYQPIKMQDDPLWIDVTALARRPSARIDWTSCCSAERVCGSPGFG